MRADGAFDIAGRGQRRNPSGRGLSHADLARILPRLIPGVAPICDGLAYRFALGDRKSVCLLPGPERERRIALIRVPYLELTLEYRELDAAERAGFRARFERAFQTGGG